MIVAITNQKGGVGKTTTAVNLGVLLAQQGRQVLLVDADPQFALTRQLGIEQRSVGVNLVDVLAGGLGAQDAIVVDVQLEPLTRRDPGPIARPADQCDPGVRKPRRARRR